MVYDSTLKLLTPLYTVKHFIAADFWANIKFLYCPRNSRQLKPTERKKKIDIRKNGEKKHGNGSGSGKKKKYMEIGFHFHGQ